MSEQAKWDWVNQQRATIAAALAHEWPSGAPATRCWHAGYTMPDGELRTAQLYQTRGAGGFQVSCVRDVAHGGAEQMNGLVVTSLEAAVWLGLHEVNELVIWAQTL